MRKLVLHSTVLCCLGMTVLSGLSQAQDQKIGYVNTDQILQKMSEYEGIQKELSTLSSEWNSQLQKMEEEIEQLKNDYEAKEILYTEELKKQKEQEIQNKVEARQQYFDEKFGSEGEYFQKQKELLEPVQRKVFKAINKVAEEQNFDFIFDRAQDSNMLFGGQEWNLNEEVLQELGITLNEASN